MSADHEERPWRSSAWRWLAGEEESNIDYSVLAVGVMTLGLIMIVEVLRHRLDHAAVGRPFFKAVLLGVYEELSTLGVVELFIWLLHSYYDNLDIDRELVFAKVHFTLFYTALINAFQSCIVAFFSTKVSQHLWIETEQLELNHYVEIREEFQRVHDQLEAVGGLAKPTSSHATKDSARSSSVEVDVEGGFGEWLSGLRDRIRYPALKSKYNQLLLQVRFHELRVHFLQAYQLPLKLKISEYLMRSELAVLIRLVHVSTVAWLLLTGAVNVLYFVMGVVAYQTENMEVVGTALIYIFFFSMGAFVLIAVILHAKMNSIFRSIMHQKVLWDVHHSDAQRQDLAEKQLSFFWLSDPKMVIASIQFMQFGYAVALSVVIIFWKTIAEGHLSMGWYVLAIFVSYAVFVFVVAKIVPRYTLCTSLGQLVDQRRLHDTIATYRLEEAKREQMERNDWAAVQGIVEFPEADELSISAADRSKSPGLVHKALETVTAPVVGGQLPKTRGSSSVSSGRYAAELMASLVKLDTSALRENLPESERELLAERQRRRNRRKSVSDGVGAMAKMGLTSLGSTEKPSRVKDDSDLQEGKRGSVFQRIRQNSKERGGLFTIDDSPSSEPPPPPEHLQVGDTSPEQLRARRRRARGRRMKSVSDGVALMSALHSSDFLVPQSVPEGEQMEDDDPDLAPVPRPALASPEVTEPASNVTRRAFNSASGRSDFSSFRPLGRASFDNEDTAGSSGSPTPVLEQGRGSLSRGNSIGSGIGRGTLSRGNSVGSGMFVSPMIDQLPEALKNAAGRAGEDASTRSTKSVGGHSDVDDIPDVDVAMLVPRPIIERPTLRQRFRKYYLSRRFVLLSNVFGTMVAFFLIGERIDAFLVTQGVISETEYVKISFPGEISFWVLFVWFLFFLLTAFLVYRTLGPLKELQTTHERTVWIGTALDVVLTLLCLTLLCVAEVQRCCHPETSDATNATHRSLAGGSSYDEGIIDYYAEPPTCSCPTFGSRLYGGLGMIEPFTSLIALRIFRFWAGHLIVNHLKSFSSTSKEDDVRRSETVNVDPFDVFGDPSHHGGGAGGGAHGLHKEQGTISELWQSAVDKYPEIVSEYGEFSGELLRAMLGLPIPVVSHQTGAAVDGGTPPTSSNLATNKPFTLAKQYSGLSPHVQEIIMAGKLGQSVKAVSPYSSQVLPPAIPEDKAAVPRGQQNFFFEVTGTETAQTDEVSSFVYPNARLVRSMRRCERKLLPILDQWSVVDVVFTRFEMIYFDAMDVDDSDDKRFDDVRQALIATKGGKGLRLCDVGIGRRVVGQLQISDIESAIVERELPHPPGPGELDCPIVHVHKSEYWKRRTDAEDFDRASKWCTTKQDVLKVRSTNGGTLCLRFYADLEDNLDNPDRAMTQNEREGDLFKTNALQWAQTIVRFCGPEQLKTQPLVHFGDDTMDELRELLVVKKDDDPRHRRQQSGETRFGGLIRTISTANLRNAATPKPALVRRMSSIGEGSGENHVQRKSFHRSSSLDDSLFGSSSSHRRTQTYAGTLTSDILSGATSKSLGVVTKGDSLLGSAKDDGLLGDPNKVDTDEPPTFDAV